MSDHFGMAKLSNRESATYRLDERRDAVGLGGRGHPLELPQLLPRQRLHLRPGEVVGAVWRPRHGPGRQVSQSGLDKFEVYNDFLHLQFK